MEKGNKDKKKIKKWVDENEEEWVEDGYNKNSSNKVRIESEIKFVKKKNDNREFKKIKKKIKDNRSEEKIK
jgi:hypothetical protein